MNTQKPDYLQQIDDLLSHYRDGHDVFIKNEWQTPLKLKEGVSNTQFTTNWLALMEQVCGLIAKGKYGLETYTNVIEIVGAERMLDLYVNVGMPRNYDHWSHGKAREAMGAAHTGGQMNLAYELVINSNPTISYCMNRNSNTMMALVIAHAAFGHNAFFKNNTMFTQFTDANSILGDLARMADYINECEVKYGVDRVEKILDACHALKTHAIDYNPRPVSYKTRAEREAHKAAVELAEDRSRNDIMDTASLQRPKPVSENFQSLLDDKKDRPLNEANLLRYIAHNAPHLEDWERRIINMFCDRSQYFYPQMRTKVMNEGFASYTHHEIMHDLHNARLISGAMMIEFISSHTSVVYQPDLSKGGFNPYALGFAIYKDIERMCKNPTDEDRRWFPTIAGNPDYMGVIKEAAFNYHDESFIYQYLSPEVMRKFHMFTLKDEKGKPHLEVTAIADDDGYRTIRRTLAESYNTTSHVPMITAIDFDARHDRTLTLKHSIHDEKELDENNALEVLRHVHQLWGHPVTLGSFDDKNNVIGVLSCPRNVTGRVIAKYLENNL